MRLINKKKQTRFWRKRTYDGDNSLKKRAFEKSGLDEKNYIKKTGKHSSSKRLRIRYKINYLKELFSIHKQKPRKIPKVHKRNNAHAVRNRYRNEFKVVDRKTNRLCNKVEEFIERCSQFISFAQKILETSKLVALVRISLDGKKIVVAITNLDESINKLVKLIEIHDGGWFPTKEEYKTTIDVIKNTKEVYDTIKDIGKQVGILVA